MGEVLLRAGLDVQADAFLAAGDGQQFAVQLGRPVPVEAEFGERLVEGDAVSFAFGFGEGSVDVENDGLQR